MNQPLLKAILVDPEAQAVVDFFNEHGHDTGSVRGSTVYANAPDDMRLLAVNCTDENAVWNMAAAMRVAFHGQPQLIELTTKVMLMPGPLGTCIVVFMDIMCVEDPRWRTPSDAAGFNG
jgi:hypothetical protein